MIAFCTVGPLALPLIWFRPGTSRIWKTGLTVGVLILSWFLYRMTLESLETLKKYNELSRNM